MSTGSLTRSSRVFRWAQPSCGFKRPLYTPNELFFGHRITSRTYTDGRSTQSSLFSSPLDQRQRTSYSGREDSVGPFQLGISQAALKRGEKAKRWSELSTSGKVLRTTQRTSNLTVILLGAGLSTVLLYALTSELFSKNSPTVLYNDACERIKASPRVTKYLHAPLVFHNTPPSVVRPRHRHRHVASQIVIDTAGREHLLLNFYVKGSSLLSSVPEDEKDSQWSGYLESLVSMSFEEVKEKASPFIESAKSAFKYLRGDVVSSARPPATVEEKSKDQERIEEHSWWGVTGLFSGLRGRRAHDGGSHDAAIAWTEGEAHADLVKNDEGYFVLRYLLIDIPNSESRNPIRVFVERAPGVRENEPIMRFHSS